VLQSFELADFAKYVADRDARRPAVLRLYGLEAGGQGRFGTGSPSDEQSGCGKVRF
jgi:hypothetical protein